MSKERYLFETIEHYLNRTSKYAYKDYLFAKEFDNIHKVRMNHE